MFAPLPQIHLFQNLKGDTCTTPHVWAMEDSLLFATFRLLFDICKFKYMISGGEEDRFGAHTWHPLNPDDGSGRVPRAML